MERLSKATGISKPTIKQLWEEAKKNHEALSECKGPHSFQNITPDKPIGRRYQCDKCGGTLGGVMVFWYNLGIIHGNSGGEGDGGVQ